ncbi:uncharacterized protein LOC115323857 [Ixodes scapularis]|uniref:uncharacterized protein LOC115323857 n=1 Tax=Ixodes scapularis TaxID=6945 RepID=UPI001A9D77A1|nr:uncharacterized protein LOC115323857 [Ixodes scapularis]
MEFETFLKVVTVLFGTLHLQPAYAADDKCDLVATTTCLKGYMIDINSHMHDLGNMETSKMDAYIENMEKSRAYPEKPKCFRWSHHCAESATKEYLDSAASTYEIFQKVIADKQALKSLAEAYKCYDSDKFAHCVTGIIDDFLRIPLNVSKTRVDELRRRVTEATNTCLVPKGQCPAAAKPGKDIGQNLQKGFSDIWSQWSGNAASTVSFTLGSLMLVLAPLVAQKLL